MSISLLLSIALAGPVATPVQRLPPVERPSATLPAVEAPEAPPGTDEVEALLRARHAEDLPTKAALAPHPGAEASLQWLARYADTLLVADRAATLLGSWPSDENTLLCADLLNSAPHPKVRAAGARCLGGQAGESAETALRGALTAADLRIGVAAATALRSKPGAVDRIPPAEVAALQAPVKTALGK